ncbi:hypothetical protein LOTGIDRAFT_134669 [Lottia gigantea]|uniref:Carbohydrate kinase FGGY N-terminal domain-containing protein n=1 Tax=Lottia gigantea TaxID=225164 RepID=V3ZNK8_LOTGI|nr:hypothetical protein LOTGIDRAFT_134669 [Lottia gigantea]ESO82436.1 hypothetical protein LOTGIDRAFT_134669 [Lottia gigantea]
MNQYSLGIDLGTTSVKVVVVDVETKSTIAAESQPTEAYLESDVGALGFEQDVKKIKRVLDTCMSRLGHNFKDKVSRVCFTGQMHGLVLWNSRSDNVSVKGFLESSKTSPLYTWQDQRASPQFIKSLPAPISDTQLATGFGCVTYLWLMRKRPEMLNFDWMGTIMDYFVYGICGLDEPVTTDQLANSFGYFDCESSSWNGSILEKEGFPVKRLPRTVQPGTLAGTLSQSWLGLKAGVQVLAPLGDCQCSFFSSLATSQNTALLNIGTSLQLGCISKPDLCKSSKASVQYFPYFNNTKLALAASLNGGNVIAQFVRMLVTWTRQIGLSVTEDDIWKQLLRDTKPSERDRNLVVDPTIFGERHTPDQLGSIQNLSSDNLDITKIFNSLCFGVVQNAKEIMPATFLRDHGIESIICSGSVLTRNQVIREHVNTVFHELSVSDAVGCDSARGAALCAIKFVKQ